MVHVYFNNPFLTITFLFCRALSNLYENGDWSHHDLSGAIAEARKHMTRCKLNMFSLENLKKFSKALEQRQKEGYKTSFIDFWGLAIDKALGNGVRHLCFLSKRK